MGGGRDLRLSGDPEGEEVKVEGTVGGDPRGGRGQGKNQWGGSMGVGRAPEVRLIPADATELRVFCAYFTFRAALCSRSQREVRAVICPVLLAAPAPGAVPGTERSVLVKCK